MTEALPEEEPAVLISARALRQILDSVDLLTGPECDDAIEEAESALERYK